MMKRYKKTQCESDTSKNISTISEDSLALLSERELKSIYLDIRAIINKGKRQRKNVKDREIELCYIQREIQLRKDSKK
jgi:hypothetical protein